MAERCRVLYLVTSLEEGGVGRVLVEHLRRLPRARFELELAAFDATGYYRDRIPADVPVHELPDRRPSRLLSRRRALRALVRARGFDVVSSHLPDANFLNLAEACGNRRPVGRVLTVHADVRGRMPLGPGRRFRLWLLRRLLARRGDRVVFLCRETAQNVAGLYGVRPEQVAVIPNGVDAAEVRARAERDDPPAWPTGGLRLLALGRLVRQKDHATLLRALAAARKQGLDASLLVLGEGPERAALERLRAELGLDAVVGLPGHSANPYPALRHADLLVLPSRFEGFPLVIPEALALGCPVLAAACPAGPAELLADGVGMLVPAGDVQALATGLVEIGRSPGRLAEFAARGPARADEYRWSDIVDRTADLLLAIVAQR